MSKKIGKSVTKRHLLLFQAVLEKEEEILSNKKLELKEKDPTEILVEISLFGSIQEERCRIQKALERIKKGTFGNCSKCGKPIELEKLTVNPQGAKCQKCQKFENGF